MIIQLSIVTTLYQSSPYVEEFYQRITAETKKITEDYEIIFVDDGSPDDSLQKAVALYEQDSKVRVIQLSRNFGHHKAIMTGLTYAKGEFVFLIDSDLEEEPELLGKFWNELHKNKEIDVVYGVQETRKGRWFERWSGEVFWNIINKLSAIDIPSNILTARLMSRKYNDWLIQYKESELFLGGVLADVGFHQEAVVVVKQSNSSTTYTFKKKINLLVSSIVSFSSKPLVYIFNLGVFITALSVLYIGKILFDKLFFDVAIQGWTSLVVSIWFFGGLIILFLGVIGIYLSKIFTEVKGRPYVVIKNIYGEDK